ncbi:MAG: ABC transporter substrate-binding protein [Bacteroidetes bacterium]|nr:ABC transporter substrate-binding protein [Bacteroidota bacterium]MBL6944625.1 ABC transporter substrate-binding protein [Bacteroidales bacterium]
MKKSIVIPLLSALILFIIIGFMSCKNDDPVVITPINISLGVILPLDMEKGLLRQNALEMAIDEINENGWIGENYKINLVIKSSEGNDRRIAAAAAGQEIIDQSKNLVGFVSCFSSSSLGIVENISIPDYFPTISGAATSKQLTGISDYFQRLCPPDGFEANVLSAQAVLYDLANVAIAVEEGDAYSIDLGQSFQEAFGSGSETLVNFSSDDPDYLTKIDQLLSGNPDAVFVSMLNPTAFITFFTRLTEMNRNNVLDSLTFILCDGLYTNELFQAPVHYMVGEINGHPKNFGAFPSADTTSNAFIYFQTKLWEKYEQQVASYNAQFYDIGYLYALAIEKTLQETGISDLTTFREMLNDFIRPVSNDSGGNTEVSPEMGWSLMKSNCQMGGVNYTGASGNCDIDEEGNTKTAYAVFKVIKPSEHYEFSIITVIP